MTSNIKVLEVISASTDFTSRALGSITFSLEYLQVTIATCTASGCMAVRLASRMSLIAIDSGTKTIFKHYCGKQA